TPLWDTRSWPAGAVTRSLFGDAEDVEPVIREDRVARHGTGPIRCEKDGDVADLFLGDVAAKRCLLDHEIARLRDAAHGAAGKGLERPGGNRIDSDVVWTEIRREISRLRLENGLRHGHRVVARHDAFDRVVGEAHDGSASGFVEKGQGCPAERNE